MQLGRIDMWLGACPREAKDHQQENRECDPEDHPVEPLNVAALRGPGMQDEMASRFKRHGLRQQPAGDAAGQQCHLGCSGWPVIPVGGCFGVENSDGFTFISSLREGDTPFGSRPLIERTYAASSQAWYSGMRLRNDGIPFGRPCMMVANTLPGSLP